MPGPQPGLVRHAHRHLDRAALRIHHRGDAVDDAGEGDAGHRLRRQADGLAGAHAAELALGHVDASDERVEVDDLEQRMVHAHLVAELDAAHGDRAGDGGAHLGVAPSLADAGELDLELLESVLGFREDLLADQLLLEQALLAIEVRARLAEVALHAGDVLALLGVLELGEELAAADPGALLDEELHDAARLGALRVHGHGLLGLEVGRVAQDGLHGAARQRGHLDRGGHRLGRLALLPRLGLLGRALAGLRVAPAHPAAVTATAKSAAAQRRPNQERSNQCLPVSVSMRWVVL